VSRLDAVVDDSLCSSASARGDVGGLVDGVLSGVLGRLVGGLGNITAGMLLPTYMPCRMPDCDVFQLAYSAFSSCSASCGQVGFVTNMYAGVEAGK
jgi:hypothetical protein